MRGTHAIRVSNRRLDYRFEVRRNITIVRGDSGTGKTTLYEMIADHTRLGQDSGVQVACSAAGGNASVYGWLLEHPDEHVFVLADGAAFGAEATRVLMYQSEHPDLVTVCLPESFEWLLLASGVIKRDDIVPMLADPSSHIDSKEYFSWEQFFSAFIREVTRGTAFAYTKARLADAYTIPANANMVMKLISRGNVC